MLLTDGANNRGITPVAGRPLRGSPARPDLHHRLRHDASRPARVHPQQQGGFYCGRGFGGGGGYGGGGGGGFGSAGRRFPLVADLPPLREVSRLTGAASYTARDESELRKVFANLPKHIVVQKEHHEVSAEFAALGPFSPWPPSAPPSGGARGPEVRLSPPSLWARVGAGTGWRPAAGGRRGTKTAECTPLSA